MNSETILGNNIRKARKAKGFSQESLAERAGFHRTYIGSVERGERNPSLRSIVAIATALGIPVADLLDGIDSSPS